MALTVLIPLASPMLIQCGQVLEAASLAFPYARLVDVRLSHMVVAKAKTSTRMDFRPCYAPDLCVSINVDAPPVTEVDAARLLTGVFSRLSAAMIDRSTGNGKDLSS